MFSSMQHPVRLFSTLVFLAVLLHEDKKLEQALQHYRIVAEVNSEQLRKLYPRSIEQARQQADAIASYLRLQGGQADVTVPKVR